MSRIPCAGALVRDEKGRLLVVLRAHEPARGTWSLPGGRVEPGEDARQACRREVLEETGLVVETGRRVGTVERAGPHGHTYVIEDFECHPVGGTLAAGTDAADVRWVTVDQLRALRLSPLLEETLTEWGQVSSSSAE